MNTETRLSFWREVSSLACLFFFFSSADFPTPLPRGWEQPRKWRGSSETRGAGRTRSRWRSCGCGLPGAQRAHCAGALNGAGLCAGGLARISLLSHELQKNARIWGICHQGAGCAGCEVTGAFPGLPQSLGTRVTLILPVYIVNASAARLKQGRGKYASQCGAFLTGYVLGLLFICSLGKGHCCLPCIRSQPRVAERLTQKRHRGCLSAHRTSFGPCIFLCVYTVAPLV